MLEPISLESPRDNARDGVRDDLDRAFAATPGIDHFCSQSAWTFAADLALMPPRTRVAYRGPEGWVALARRKHDGWSSLEPLEAAWCFASPFAFDGDPGPLAHAFVDALYLDAPRDVLLLAGIPAGSPLESSLVRALAPRYVVEPDRFPPTRRHRASLEGGVDGFLARRRPTFRARLRQAARKAAAAGVRFERLMTANAAEASAALERLIDLERRSWKGREDNGLLLPEMAAFYRTMIPMLVDGGGVRGVRAQVGVRDGVDVALILGGVTETIDGSVYRGLQFSFDDALRPLSLGNLAQLAQIEALAAEGVGLYDLGSDVDYKKRWGESSLDTVALLAIPRSLRVASRGSGVSGASSASRPG